MRRVLMVLALVLAICWHVYAVKMARLEGQSLGLDQCREIFVREKR